MTAHDVASDALLRRADESYFHAWRIMAGNAVGGAVVDEGPMLLAASGVPVPWMNIAFVTAPLADARASLRLAVEFFDARGLPFVIRIREGLDAAADAACAELRLPFSDAVPALVLAPISDAPSALASLAIRRADSAAMMRDFEIVVAGSYDMPLEFAERLLPPALVDVPGCEWFVGYAGGAPVATSALVVGDGVAGVHVVGCVPAARRSGFGEAMTWECVRRGRELGCDVAVLQASDMGRPIYERMGFRLITAYRTFMRPSPAD